MGTVESQCVKCLYSVLWDMKWGAIISIWETRIRNGQAWKKQLVI